MIQKLLKLQPVSFSWKHKDPKKKVYGFIAQDVETIFPDMVYKMTVTDSNDDSDQSTTEKYSLKYLECIPLLVKTVQQQQHQLNDLFAILRNKFKF